MKFIGRTEQIELLQKEINSQKNKTILIYGRRRVGKSELVKYVLKNNKIKNIYYECRQVTEQNNVENLSNLISENFDLPKLGFLKIEELLEYIFSLATKENMILVLDEFPYLRENVKGLDSIIQSLIDKYKDNSKLKLILLGSYVDIMKSLLEHSNPLFGRIDRSINLQQMDYYESSLFYPNFCDEDKIKIYSVFGGIPYFNQLVDDSISVEENIINLIASPNARLENEVSMYLSAEISKIVNANEVFQALAKGFSKFSDILSQSHVSSSPTLVDVLDKLIRMEVVKKIAPINDENNKKKAGYYICDNLSNFYFRYIFRYSSQLKIMNSKVFYKKYIQDDFESYFVPHQFEEISRQYLIRQNQNGKIEPVLEKIGKYYYDDPLNKKNGEFDLVSQDENGYIFYEVKFRKGAISQKIIEQEIEQVKATGLDCYRFVFISRSDFNVKLDKTISLIKLKELYKK